MQLIKKIEIKNFRSFHGTKIEEPAFIDNIVDLTIFSGSNDCGKSNILRALNLFFNGEIDYKHRFIFEKDFPVSKKNDIQKVTEIKINFEVNKRSFSISRFFDKNGHRNFEYRFTEKNKEIIIDDRSEKNKERYEIITVKEDPKEKKSMKNKRLSFFYKDENGQNKINEIKLKETNKFNEEVLDKEEGYRRYLSKFISSICFSYVPAIKDEAFFSNIYGKVISQIKNNEETAIEKLENEKNQIKKFKKTLDNTSISKKLKKNLSDEKWREERIDTIEKEILNNSSFKIGFTDLEKQINVFSQELFDKTGEFLPSQFQIGEDLLSFFEKFNIGTGKDKDISLKLRGDGIQAKFIPEMLVFLDSLKKTSKKYFVWGFEEPENSLEYKNQQELSQKLKGKTFENKQVFLTTHSEEFLSLYDGHDIEEKAKKANLYHIIKPKNREFSTIQQFSSKNDFNELDRKSLDDELGTSFIRAKYSKELHKINEDFIKDKEEIERKNQEMQEKTDKELSELKNCFPPKIFICEDENGVTIWKSFFEKYHIKDIAIFSSKGCSVNNNVEGWISENIKRQDNYNPKVFRELDRDGYTNEQISFLEEEIIKKSTNLGIKNYKINFLPVNELENFAVLAYDCFTNEIPIDENYNKLEICFDKTSDSNVGIHAKTCCNKKLFDFSAKPTIIALMRQEAKKNILKFFPGKDIAKLKQNFNTDSFLKDLELSEYPEELTNYLKDIKEFFELKSN